jgi:toxin ParE1/3/4
VRVELHPEARAELRLAAVWYEERRAGLGDQLVERIEGAIVKIAAHPTTYPVWPGIAGTHVTLRKASVEQFPYVIAFEVHASRILVLAIAHAKRRPLYWRSRASGEPE